jgi:hypothetical protein
MLQACKALGLALDDVVPVCDVMAGRNITGACHALWSVASACVQLGMKACPLFHPSLGECSACHCPSHASPLLLHAKDSECYLSKMSVTQKAHQHLVPETQVSYLDRRQYLQRRPICHVWLYTGRPGVRD